MANFKHCVKYVEIRAFFRYSFFHMWPKTKDLPWILATCKFINTEVLSCGILSTT